MSVQDVIRQALGPVVGARFTNQAGAFEVGPDEVLLRVYDCGVNVIAVEQLAAMFGHVFPDLLPAGDAPVIYDSLIAAVTSGDGVVDSAWKDIFDLWRSQNLIA